MAYQYGPNGEFIGWIDDYRPGEEADPSGPATTYSPAVMNKYWQGLESAYGLPTGFMPSMAGIESRGGQNLTSPTGAVGPFQFTGVAAKGVGVPKDALRDPFVAAAAAAQLARDNADAYRRANNNQNPSGYELYMMHQQGAYGGLATLGATPGTKVRDLTPNVRKNILDQGVAGINSNSLVSDFTKEFAKRYTAKSPFNQGDFDPNAMASDNRSAIEPYDFSKMNIGLRADQWTPDQWLQTYQPDAWRQQQPQRRSDILRDLGEMQPRDFRELGQRADSEWTPDQWMQTYQPDEWRKQLATNELYTGRGKNFDRNTEEGWLRWYAPDNAALQPGEKYGEPLVQLAKGGSNTGVGLVYDPSTGAYVPNTGGMGEEERWERQFAPNAPDLQPGGKYGPPGSAPTPAPAPMTEAQWLQAYSAPTAADLNGFQSTQYQPIAVPDVSSVPSVSYNPSAAASTIPSVPLGSAYTDPVVPSYGNPMYQLGNTSLGGSPGGTAPANPFYVDPNAVPSGGTGPMVLTVPFSSSQVGYEI